MNEKGVTDDMALSRVRNEVGCIHKLREIGVKFRGFEPATCIRILKSLILAKWEYALRLTPMTKRLQSAIESAEGLFYKYVFGKYAEHRRGPMRVLFQLEPPEMRRRHQAERFSLNLFRHKKWVEETEDYPGRQEDILEAAKDIQCLNEFGDLRKALQKAHKGSVSNKNRRREIIDIWTQEENGRSVTLPVESKKLPWIICLRERTTRLRYSIERHYGENKFWVLTAVSQR